MAWTRGRGALGFLTPVLGVWRAEGDGYVVERRLERTLGGAYVRMDVRWRAGDRDYAELALFGRDADKTIRFWSFTSDGRQSSGWFAGRDVPEPGGFAFEADMPAGRGRMLFWPAEDDGFRFAVESRNRRGWKRFVDHRYRRT